MIPENNLLTSFYNLLQMHLFTDSIHLQSINAVHVYLEVNAIVFSSVVIRTADLMCCTILYELSEKLTEILYINVIL